VGGRHRGAQSQNAGDPLPDIRIGWDQTFGVQLAEGDVLCPLVQVHRTEAVQRPIHAFANADSGSRREPERMGGQIVGAAQFLLEKRIVFRRQRSGQIFRLGKSWRPIRPGWIGCPLAAQSSSRRRRRSMRLIRVLLHQGG
jgi:hypothetical protein